MRETVTMASAAKFRQLEILKTVADHGSMTRAAQSLDISQPAVSRVISDLTELFGFSLFDRKDGLLIPSKETRYILPDISRVIELMDHIQYTTTDLTARRAGHLRVACLPGFAPNVSARVAAKEIGCFECNFEHKSADCPQLATRGEGSTAKSANATKTA